MSQSTLIRLMTLLSPSFPVGGFAYSSGLEQAVADGLVTDGALLSNWLRSIVQRGFIWNDAVLLGETHRQATNGGSLAEIAALAEALAGSNERHMEQANLGDAFVEATRAGRLELPPLPNDRIAYPVAIGAACAAQGLALEHALSAFLHAFVSNQIQCAIRLGVLGQNGGVALLTGMEPVIAETAARANHSTLDDLGSSALMADISSMRHETLYSRIFRT